MPNLRDIPIPEPDGSGHTLLCIVLLHKRNLPDCGIKQQLFLHLKIWIQHGDQFYLKGQNGSFLISWGVLNLERV